MPELRIRCVHCGAQRPIGEAPCPACGGRPHPHKSTIEEFQARMDALHGPKGPGKRRRDRNG
jgi:hypothetical protein